MKFPEWDSKKVLEWIQSCAIYFSLRPHEREDLWIREAGLHLTGAARDWWEGKVKADPELTGELFKSWATFTKRLRQQFGVHDLEAEAMTKLLSLQQDTKGLGSGMRYIDSFRELALQADQSEDNKMMRTIFERGLLPTYRRPFDADPPTTLTGWYQRIEQLEKTWSRNAFQLRTRDIVELGRKDTPAAGATPDSRVGTLPEKRLYRPLLLKTGTDRSTNNGGVGRSVDPVKSKFVPRSENPARLVAQRPGTQVDKDICILCKQKGHWSTECPNSTKGVHVVMTEYGPAALHESGTLEDYLPEDLLGNDDDEALNTEDEGSGKEDIEVVHNDEQGNGHGAK
jgi:hypothetical protein